MAGAELVEGKLDAVLAEVAQDSFGRCPIVHGQRLGDLEDQAGGIKTALAQGAANHCRQLLVLELTRGEIDRDADGRSSRALPVSSPTSGLPQDPFAERLDHAGLLSQADEGAGEQHAFAGILSARQRSQTHDPAVRKADLRLEMDDEGR